MTPTVARKISYAFGSLVALMVVSVVVILMMTSNTRRWQQQVDKRVAATTACSELMAAINASMTALQSYMILGSDARAANLYQSERNAAWEQVDESLATLGDLASEWASLKEIRRFEKVRPRFEKLRTAQEQVEQVAHTEENVSSHKMFLSEAEPAAREIRNMLTTIIASQDAAVVSERQRLSEANTELTVTTALSGLLMIILGLLMSSAIRRGLVESTMSDVGQVVHLPSPSYTNMVKAGQRPALPNSPLDSATKGVAMQGTVKFFNVTKGFGFIAPSDGSPDVFVHQADIHGTALQEGDRVEFEVTEGEKGRKAANVRAVDVD